MEATSSAPRSTDGPFRHNILLVHGVGEQARGDSLAGFTNGLYDYMHVKLDRQDGKHDWLHLDVDAKDASATIQYDDGATREEFYIKEVWWAKVFKPYPLTKVLVWLVSTMVGRFTKDRRWRSFQEPAALALVVALAALGLVGFGTLWLLQNVPQVRTLMNSLQVWLQKRMSALLVGVVGDVTIFTSDLYYADVIRVVLEQELAAVDADPVDGDITVVAHSQGSFISYETLARSYRQPLKKEVTFVSVGSPLDKIWWFLKERHRYRFVNPLPPSVKRWLNIYSRYDLVADRLHTYDHPRLKPDNRLVTNSAFFLPGYFRDHSAYWSNYQVMELLLEHVATSQYLGKRDDAPVRLTELFTPIMQAQMVKLANLPLPGLTRVRKK